jgi:hypothetical protein
MTGLDWTSYEAQPAPRDLLCQFRRQDGKYLWEFVGYAKDFLPEFDIAGLKWRLTGIAREELDGMTPEEREKALSRHPVMVGGFWNELSALGAHTSGLLGPLDAQLGVQEQSPSLSTLDQVVLGMYNPWSLAEWTRRNKPVKL